MAGHPHDAELVARGHDLPILFVHVAIPDASPADYQALDDRMAGKRLLRRVRANDRTHELPPAVYRINDEKATRGKILKQATEIAAEVKPGGTVLVIEATRASWDGLPEIT